MGVSEWRGLGDVWGLSHFGGNLDGLQLGAQSALRNWHTQSEEFVYVLDDELILVTDEDEQILHQGKCVGFPAGGENGHHLINHSPEVATFLAVGSRVGGNKVHYPDDDLQWLKTETGAIQAAKKDGTVYE